jgi:biotin operon repressor
VNLIVATSGTDSRVYENGYEAYKFNGESVKDKARVGALQYRILRMLAESGLRQFSLHEVWRTLNVDRRRAHQAIAHLQRRGIVARVARGLYRLLVDPWELLGRAVVQGPNGRSVKDSDGTRSAGRVGSKYGDGGVVGLFFDNVRGFGGFGRVPGDRGRVLGRGDLVRFDRVSYAEVGVATGTRLMEGLGVLVVYFGCKGFGPYAVCSDWVEWRPPSGFYSRYSIVEAVNVYRSRVLPYALGLVARAGVVAGAPVDRFRAAVYGLARQLYLALRPKPGNSSNCKAPSVEPNGDGSFTVCFNCPPALWRRLLNTSRVSGHSWNSIITEILSGTLP